MLEWRGEGKQNENKKKVDGESSDVEECIRVSQVRAGALVRSAAVHVVNSFTGVHLCVRVIPASSSAVSLETGSWCWSETRRRPSSPLPLPPERGTGCKKKKSKAQWSR